MNFTNVGIPVTIIENNEDALKRGMATIEKKLPDLGAARLAQPEDMARRLALFRRAPPQCAEKTPASSSRRCSRICR